MANYTVTPTYPISADVVALALQLAQRMSDSGTNAGIADNGNPALGLIGQGGPYDVLSKGTAYLQGMADAIMCAVGFQAAATPGLSANSTTSASLVDVPGSSFTFTAPLAKTYMVHCDFAPFFSAGTSPRADIALVINGHVGPLVTININDTVDLNLFQSIHVMHAAACSAGSNTIKLQWRVTAGGTLNISGASYANYLVSG